MAVVCTLGKAFGLCTACRIPCAPDTPDMFWPVSPHGYRPPPSRLGSLIPHLGLCLSRIAFPWKIAFFMQVEQNIWKVYFSDFRRPEGVPEMGFQRFMGFMGFYLWKGGYQHHMSAHVENCASGADRSITSML